LTTTFLSRTQDICGNLSLLGEPRIGTDALRVLLTPIPTLRAPVPALFGTRFSSCHSLSKHDPREPTRPEETQILGGNMTCSRPPAFRTRVECAEAGNCTRLRKSKAQCLLPNSRFFHTPNDDFGRICAIRLGTSFSMEVLPWHCDWATGLRKTSTSFRTAHFRRRSC